MTGGGEPLKRLLAVDDDVSSAELIVRIAERCRFEAFATSDSRGVMNLTNALHPDVLAVDIQMPNLDAHDLFYLLADAGFAGQVLVVSGNDHDVLERTRREAENLGLNAPCAFRKPLDIGVLRSFLTSGHAASAA